MLKIWLVAILCAVGTATAHYTGDQKAPSTTDKPKPPEGTTEYQTNSYVTEITEEPSVNVTGTTVFTTIPSTSEPTTGCCPSMQNQVNYLLVHSQLQDQQISDLQSEVDSLQEQLDALQSPPSDETYRNCEEASLEGVTESGTLTIDPDGNGPTDPFEVYCDFTTDPPTALVGHDSEEQTLVTGCQDPGCYSHNVTYDVSMDQIVSLISNSDSCSQYIEYQCYASMMFYYSDYVWWLSRDGVKQFYWGGATPNSYRCACGENGTCAGGMTTCNCDNNDEIWRQDDGYLTAKDTLPVTQLDFGDVYSTAERGYFTLGKLECQGTAKNRDCGELKLAGKPSGYYDINPDPARIQAMNVYCDMDSYPGTGITVITHNVTGQSDALYSNYGETYIPVGYQNADLDQMAALADISRECRQYIEWQCYETGMLYNTNTHWVSRDGESMYYWGGADPSHTGYCGCGETETCEPSGYYQYHCNCDYVSSTTRVDGGFLYDKNRLPVTAMNYDFYYSSSYYYGYYTLGDFECY